jgi:hypothetical protein
MGAPTPFAGGPDVGPAPLEPGWYPDPWHESDQRYWDGSTWVGSAGWYPDPEDRSGQRYWDGARWGQARSPRKVAQRRWLEAPSTARVLFWALIAQALVLVCGGLYGFVASLHQPSTGSGIRELATLVWFVIMLMGLGCVGVALGVHRRHAWAVVLAALMELPATVLLPVAAWSLIGHYTIEATPFLIPLIMGLVALAGALHPRTSHWVRGR